MFLDEMSLEDKNLIINLFISNKTLVLSGIIKGCGQFSSE